MHHVKICPMLGVRLKSRGALLKTKLLKINVNEINVHKSTLFFCLHNYFLRKLTLQYFSVAVPAVPSGEIVHGSFTTMSSLSISITSSLSEKANCNVSPCLSITFTLYVKASFSLTCPA